VSGCNSLLFLPAAFKYNAKPSLVTVGILVVSYWLTIIESIVLVISG